MGLDVRVWGSIFPELSPPSSEPRGILGFRLNWIHFVTTATGESRVTLTGMGPTTYFWEPGRNRATCARFRYRGPATHQAPASRCHCGFHAFDRLEHIPAYHRSPAGQLVLVGVAGTGLIRIHWRGWRAQFARIVAFCDEMPGPMAGFIVRRTSVRRTISDQLADALEATYHAPVVSLKNLRAEMRAHGQFVEEMR